MDGYGASKRGAGRGDSARAGAWFALLRVARAAPALLTRPFASRCFAASEHKIPPSQAKDPLSERASGACHHYREWRRNHADRYSNVELADCAKREAYKRRRA